MGGMYEEIRIALHAIWMRRWLALAVAWAIAVLGWLGVSQIPNRYESRARVFVNAQSILPSSVAGNPQAAQNDVDTIRQTLVSAVNLQRVVRGTDLAATVANDHDVADRVATLQKNITVTAQQDNLFELKVTTGSPRLSQQVAQKLIDIFVEQNLAGDRDQNGNSLRFLDAQLAQRGQQLQAAEQRRNDFENRYMGSLPGTGSMSDRMSAARSQMAQIDGDLAAAQSSLGTVTAQMAGTPATVAGSGGGMAAAGPARARLAAIQGQLADARGRGYTDAHPDVIALRAQLAQATAAARNEPLVGGGAAGQMPNPLYQSLQQMRADRQATVASLTMRKAQIQNDIDQITRQLSSNPQAAADQASIERDTQVLRTQYDQLLADREQLRIRGSAQAQGDASKFRVIDPPTAASVPTFPNRPLLLTGVLLAAAVLGLGGAFALGKLKGSFPTSGRLEKVSGLPVIGSVSRVLTPAEKGGQRRRMLYFSGGAAALAVAWVALLAVEMIQRSLAA